ncbi:MAG: aminopeptidase P family N-terminal domain-containing protein [Anaerolineales bacterium]|nr:aminopeptidase P family N-terminal domain-containing protein [Anaerolineales bacterium]
MNAERLQRLMTVTRQHGLAGLALVPGHSMDYVSEIHSHTSERPIVLFLPVDGEPAIIIPALEAMKASADGIPPERIFAYTDEEWYPAAFCPGRPGAQPERPMGCRSAANARRGTGHADGDGPRLPQRSCGRDHHRRARRQG